MVSTSSTYIRDPLFSSFYLLVFLHTPHLHCRTLLNPFKMASAVYRTLALPEIIMTIASFLEDDLPALVSCLHVNRLWSEAATLYLWSTCGDGLGDAIPHIHHLTSLASTPERMNRYASCVKELAFSVAEAGDDLDSALETQKAYHDILANAAFPRLEKVNFGDFDYESVYYSTSSLLLQYVRPKLRTFSAFVSPPNQGEYVSDGFLASMKVRFTQNSL